MVTEESPAIDSPQALLTDEGKRALAAKDYETAIDSFGRALSAAINASTCPNDDPMVAPFYARYGKALMESAVETCSLVNPKAAVNAENHGKIIDLSEDEDAQEDVNEDENEDANEDNLEDEEEVSDFDLAWEMFDAARLIYSKQSSAEYRILEAAVLEDLADLSMEMESFEQAIQDYQSALSFYQQKSGDNHRTVASIFFKLGMALEYSGCITDAIDALTKAHQSLSITPPHNMSSPDDEKGKGRDDMPSILAEVESKLEELKAGKNINTQVKDVMMQSAVSPAPVNDLSSLVKKRRM